MKENFTTVWKERQCARTAWSGSPGAISRPSGDGPGQTGTLYELSRQYGQAAQALRERIRLLEEQRERENGCDQRYMLDARLRLLRSMWRDTRAVCVHLEHYYERGVSRNAKYII